MIDIVIPTYDNRPELETCLESLARQTRRDFTAYVCVDGSGDGTVEYLESSTFPFELRILQHPDRQNHGRAAARNLAVRHLSARFVLFLDSDMRLARDGLDRHLTVLHAQRCVSVGRVVYLNAAENVWARFLQTRGVNRARAGAFVRPLDFVTANSAVPTDEFVNAGGFDESLTGYGGEDTDLALKLASRGLTFVANPAAIAASIEEKTFEQGLDELDRFSRTNLEPLRRRYPSGPAPFWVDRLRSPRARDLLLRAVMNPITDRVARALVGHAPFPVQRLALNYLVVRTVFRGYAEVTR